jgi:phosphoribosylformylglycinamidine (FGAM) synthase-like amidotransferase family enzyme
MEILTLESVKDLKQGDKVKITLEDKNGQEISKQGTFHSIEENEILIKQYGKKKSVWVMELNKCGRIEKINKFENAKRESNINMFH